VGCRTKNANLPAVMGLIRLLEGEEYPFDPKILLLQFYFLTPQTSECDNTILSTEAVISLDSSIYKTSSFLYSFEQPVEGLRVIAPPNLFLVSPLPILTVNITKNIKDPKYLF